MTAAGVVTILNYRPEHQPDFERLNRHWIEKYFWMEPIDYEVLQRPETHIIEKGGHILMAAHDNTIAGTVAMKWVEPGIFEFTKMAVDDEFQGRKIGLALAQVAIQWARSKKARKIILYSNTKLEAAVNLYRRLGFQEVPVDGPYKRSNIKMELSLNVL